MKTWKRRLAALMASVLLVSLLPTAVLAEELELSAEDPLASTVPVEKLPENNEPTAGLSVSGILSEEEMSADTQLAEEAQAGTLPSDGMWESNLEIRELGVTIDGQYVAAVPVEELPPEELSQEEEEMLARIPAPTTLTPITEHKNYTLNLRSFWPDQLKAVTLSVVSSNLTGGSIAAPAGTKIMWAKSSRSNDYREIDDFTVMDADGTMDLTPEYQGASYVYLHLIIGTADQFDSSNERYLIQVNMPRMSSLFEAQVATVTNVTVPVFSSSYSNSSQYLWVYVDGEQWTSGTGKLALTLRSGTSTEAGLTSGQAAAIYVGRYETAAEAEQSGTDITTSILNQTMPSGGYTADLSKRVELTLVVKKGSDVVQILPFVVRVSGLVKGVSFYQAYDNSGPPRNSVLWSSSYDDNHVQIIGLKPGYSADNSYYISLNFSNPDPSFSGGSCGINNVKAAYQGNYADQAAAVAAGASEIKANLFSYASSGGFLVNLKETVNFTIIDVNDNVYHTAVRAQAAEPVLEELPSAPTPLSADTYFQAKGAYRTAQVDGAINGSKYDAYVMPYAHDSYYYNGYQTIFLMDGANPIADGTSIYPEFFSGTKVTVHAGRTEVGEVVSTSEQKSGETGVEFHNGQSIPYSAAAENTKSLKNYWVTFLTQQTSPTLFVNGVTNADEAHKDDDGTPIREVILDEAHDYHHDVFIANLGSTAMNDLTVTLSDDAKNIQLDEYWTVDGTKSLGAFTTTTRTTTAGELGNVTKIRLLPVRDDQGNIISGDISGTLTITGGGETITVKLTGRSGRFVISTDRLVDGVKYVHYSSVIQTSNMYEADAVRFSLVEGPLPSGLVLRSSGEIYGVPTVTSTQPWHVKVRAAYTDSDGKQYTDEKEYDLTIIDNTDANVWNATDTNYELLRAIVNEDNTVSLPQGHVSATDLSEGNSWNASAQTFWSHGEYGNFQVTEVRLDSERLTRGRDYTDEAGSTKITIQNQTLRSRGNGTHTISVEFREGGANGILKRTAQNYTLNTLGIQSPGSSGSSGSSSSSSSSSSTKRPTKQPDQSVTPATKPTFEDVPMDHTFYNDVEWAYDNGLMQGITARRFAPRNAITQATVVTVLARIANVDLSSFENNGEYPTIPTGAWYTNAAVWATQAGLLPNNTSFDSEGPISRANMAIMLVKYLASMEIDVSVPVPPVAFADADQMSQEANNAFQVLYHYGIFKGVGNYYMEPDGTTTRAQFSALIHRMNTLIEQ